MPWSNGKFTRTNDQYQGANIWQDEASDADPTIKSGNHDRHDQDIADGIDATLNLDGQNAMRANLDAGGFEVIDAGDPTQAQSLVTLSYLQSELNGLAAVATSGDYGDLINTPSLSSVATSGDYGDLVNTPTVPAVLDDLSDVDTNGAVDDSILKYQGGQWVIGVDGGGGGGATSLLGLSDTPSSYNSQGGNALTVNGSENGVEFTILSDVATSGSYTDLSNRPALSSVATSGSYNDLSDKPNTSTNLSQSRNSTSVTVQSSTGSNAVIPAATTSNAGVFTASDKSKLNGLDNTDLSLSRTATTATVQSSTGNNAQIPAATTSLAGVLTAADKDKLDDLPDDLDDYLQGEVRTTPPVTASGFPDGYIWSVV